MLANGAKLGFKKSGGASFTDLPGLKEIPEMGIEPEKVENTCLTDKNKSMKTESGTLVIWYINSGTKIPKRIVRIELCGKPRILARYWIFRKP